ncbi:MAG: transketolase [Selenomonas ruminantium]|uniref:Transketolase n=1 Tax=Selenomonas ruminantium TaxID=971 RepID=A0A927WGX1_SELRU|nr:transketolase C-terminal domain-containing protein [Selenomonas ruminantium]MBE6084546.1 transketolase [Selenomonas ruminantium]
MQSAYIGKLMEIAEHDNKVIHLLADSGTGYDEMFRYNFPKQIHNFGISEEHMVAAAAGMATVGYVPFVYTAGAFLAYRSLEFIRDDICFQNLNVKIVGMGSGLSWSSLGPTHHTTEDVAVLRSLPNLMILSPATPRQVAACVQATYEHQGPVYIRIGMNHEKEFFPDNYTLKTASNDVLQENGDISIFVTGSILEEVQRAVEALGKEGYGVNLINVPVIKPLANGQILSMVKKSRLCFTVEEHNVLGGLGSAIAEVLTEYGIGVPLHRIGLKDTFAVGYGTHAAVRKANSLDAQSIYQQIKERL